MKNIDYEINKSIIVDINRNYMLINPFDDIMEDFRDK